MANGRILFGRQRFLASATTFGNFTFVDNALGTLGGRPRVLGATGCSVSESVSLELPSVFEWTA